MQVLITLDDFCYLGSMVASSTRDLKRHRGLAWTACWKLERLWKDQSVPLQTKLSFSLATCLSVLLYGCESWVLTQDMTNKVNSFATSCYRIMLNIKHTNRVSSDEVCSKVGTGPLVSIVIQRQLRFLGHQLRRDTKEHSHLYAPYIPPHGKRKPGRQPTNFLKYIQELLGDRNDMLSTVQIAQMACDRTAWRRVVVDCSTTAER